MDKQFVKMSALVNEDITIQSVQGFQFKFWDNTNNKMLVSDSWIKDYQKKWAVITDKGQLDVSQSQMGSMLESASHSGKADINNMTFNIKSNGKQGMEIRYFINPVRQAIAKPESKIDEVFEVGDTPLSEDDLSNIPF